MIRRIVMVSCVRFKLRLSHRSLFIWSSRSGYHFQWWPRGKRWLSNDRSRFKCARSTHAEISFSTRSSRHHTPTIRMLILLLQSRYLRAGRPEDQLPLSTWFRRSSMSSCTWDSSFQGHSSLILGRCFLRISSVQQSILWLKPVPERWNLRYFIWSSSSLRLSSWFRGRILRK